MFKGYYINLKHSKDRNNSIKKQLKKLRLEHKYKRIEAINGDKVYNQYITKLDKGSLGCWLSHEKILSSNYNSTEHLHILEDDALLSSAFIPAFESLQSKVNWDIIFTDVYFSMMTPSNFCKINEKQKLFKEKKQISLLNLYGIPFNGTTSYFINKNSIEKFDKLMGRDYSSTFKHDSKINYLIQTKKLNAYTMMPFTTSISSSSTESTIDEKYNTNLLAMDFIRKSFFIEANTQQILQEVKNIKKEPDDSILVDIYTSSTKIMLNNIHNKRYIKKKSLDNKLSFVMPVTFNEINKNLNWRKVSNEHTVIRFQTMIKSFLKMYKQDDLEIFFILVPFKDISLTKKLLEEITLDKRYLILSEEKVLDRFNIDIKKLKVSGWITQQLLKLAISQYIKTEYYITLDNDILCVKPSSYDILIKDKKALLGVENKKDYENLYTNSFAKIENSIKSERYNNSSKLLGYTRKSKDINTFYSETPVILNKKVVKDLLIFLDKKHNTSWLKTLQKSKGWTEYGIYFCFLEMTNDLENIYKLSNSNTILDLNKSIWQQKEYYKNKRTYNKDFFKDFEGYFIAIQSWLGTSHYLDEESGSFDCFYEELGKLFK